MTSKTRRTLPLLHATESSQMTWREFNAQFAIEDEAFWVCITSYAPVILNPPGHCFHAEGISRNPRDPWQ